MDTQSSHLTAPVLRVDGPGARECHQEPHTETDWLGLARSFLVRIEAARTQAEQYRAMPHDLVRAMAEAGLFRLKLPRRCGGAELDHLTYFQLVEEVSRVHASAGWLVAVGNECAATLGYLPAAVADDMLRSDADVIVAGALKSRHAELQVVDGGYRLRGRWMLASGCPEASWFGAAALVPDVARGRPDLRLFILPRSDCRIVETWEALGLRATASHDFEVSDAFVPAERCFPFADARSELPGALWRGDFRSHLGGIAAVALGTARAAIDELVALAVAKVPFLGTATLRDRSEVQANVGRAEALVRSGRALLNEVLGEMWRTQLRGDDLTTDALALRDLAAVNAVQSSARAVELMYDSAGSTAVYVTSNLERCFRDVHTITQHIAGSASRYEPLGRHLMEMRR